MKVPSEINSDTGPHLCSVIDAIGTNEFDWAVWQYLAHVFQARSFSLVSSSGPEYVTLAAWPPGSEFLDADTLRYDVRRSLREASRNDVQISVRRVAGGDDEDMTPLAQFLLVRRRNGAGYACAIVCPLAMDRPLRGQAGLIFAAALKHFVGYRETYAPPLDAVDDIESFIRSSTRLSERESEVCARVVHGLSTDCIAEDLGIGRESVQTYRKRAYERLGVNSLHQLMRWYISTWGTEDRARQSVMDGPAS